MFSGLRQQSLFYILEKGQNPNLKVGNVTAVSNPQPKFNQFPNTQPFGQTETVVDVTVKVGEQTMEFKQLPSSLSIANSGSVVVSDNREAMIAEVEAMLASSKHILESIPYHQSVVAACDDMMTLLNPQIAKEREQERKIGELETKMDGIENALHQIVSMLSTPEQGKPSKKSKED